MARVVALIVAGGGGSRLGGAVPKQYQLLGGMPVLRRAVLAFARHPGIHAVQVVHGLDDAARAREALAGLDVLPFTVGGATRQESVKAGLDALAGQGFDYVLVHDAARPFVSAALIDRVLTALETHQAVLPTIPIADTLKYAPGATVERTVSREHLHAAQTPQGFEFALLHRLHAEGGEATDDAMLAEAAGLLVAHVPGERCNLKLTTPEDWAMAEASLVLETRVGQGFDVHKLIPAEGRPLMICGVAVPHSHALEGHSDADVGLHALTDAILGALAEGDIGTHFPPSDARWKNADSVQFLTHAAGHVRKRGGRILHTDITLICEAPKMRPHIDAMRARVAALLGVNLSRVSIKATTTETLGFTGRREGIAAQAVASVALPGDA